MLGGRREKLADDTRRLRISSYRTIKPYSRLTTDMAMDAAPGQNPNAARTCIAMARTTNSNLKEPNVENIDERVVDGNSQPPRNRFDPS
ncbi:hypothetical protein RBWH47_02047 [Rhodopirellula baltica WH47]|uniref:Uncharacterized protein n=1 Tax=Rhodopirellula baltica WH47 TaxID=991778 RepID=F2ASA1_RHOBT|nr:hypothetical protein RBWH47_02047 [Rhodopirellula baltica WH47]